MLVLRAILAALVGLSTGRASAQCTITGSVAVASIALRDDLVLGAVDLPSVEVDWPPATTGPTRARLRSPFDAPVEIEGAAYHLAPSARLPTEFFDAPLELPAVVGVERDGREDVLRIEGMGIHGLSVRCDDIRFGAARVTPGTEHGTLGFFLVAEGLELFAGPQSWAPSVRITPGGRTVFDVVERREGWVSLEMRFDGGVVLRGWAPADPARETSTRGLRTMGGVGRGAGIGLAPMAGCYDGPAFFSPATAVYAHEGDTRPWGTVTDGDALTVRDCGLGPRVEIVGALGWSASFGWVDRRDLGAWRAIE